MFKTHKSIYLILAILAAVAITAGLLFAIQNFKTDEEIAATILSSPPGEGRVPKGQERLLSGDIFTWQTYRNEEYGFEFKYPKNLYVIPNKYSLFNIQSTKLFLQFGGRLEEGLGKEGVDFASEGYQIQVDLLDKEDADAEFRSAYYSRENMSFSGIKAVRYYLQDGITRGPIVLIEYPNDNTKYISVSYKASCSSVEVCTLETVNEVFNQILSTFKFTKPETPIIKNSKPCAAVIQRAKNVETGEIRDFPTPCDVPSGWENIPDGPCPCQVGNACYTQETCI